MEYEMITELGVHHIWQGSKEVWYFTDKKVAELAVQLLNEGTIVPEGNLDELVREFM